MKARTWIIIAVAVAILLAGGALLLIWPDRFQTHTMMGPVAIVTTPQEKEAMERPILGVALASAKVPLTIREVPPGSAADHAGLRAGDQIMAIGNTKRPTMEGLRFELRDRKVGEVVNVTILRDGVEKSISVPLTRMADVMGPTLPLQATSRSSN